MKEYNILAILPYDGLKETLLAAARDFTDLSLNIFIGDLDQGLEIAKQELRADSYDAIISRGKTASLLQESIPEVPVLAIPILFEDVFRTIMLARNYSEKFAIVSFPSVAKKVAELNDLLQYQLNICTIHSKNEVRTLLPLLQQDGYSMVVGDVATVEAAKAIGINSLLLISGIESVTEALNQARLICQIKAEARQKTSYQALFSNQMNCIFAIIHPNGDIVESNFEHSQHRAAFEHFIRNNFSRFFQTPTTQMERQIGQSVYYIISNIDMVDHEQSAVIFGIELYAEESDDTKNGIFLENEAANTSYIYKGPFSTLNSVGHSRDAILAACKSQRPILIAGEYGTGKDAAARSIHLIGSNKDTPYFIVDCELLNKKEWISFFEKPSSPFMHIGCTIYICNIQLLPVEYEAKLRELIEHSNLCRRNRMIFSATMEEDVLQCSFARFLIESTNCFFIRTYPLRERNNDIDNLLVLYLNDLNVELGRQITGFDPKAKELLLNYKWPRNVPQMKKVLHELVVVTQKGNITEKAVRQCLKNELFETESGTDTGLDCGIIDIEQPLNNIIFDIINILITKRGMTRQQVADKLQISRSTIWRIMQSQPDCDIQTKLHRADPEKET